ncbi:hypothetical protein AB0J83_14935 [Actinoplanes sp. NPDC049596]|uniref:hypothetical protein n=1 Tax=unclassified Actinoplanes TaxID=2626549 RepID=UPI0034349CC9
MERGPLALFGAIIAVGLGPALWMGVQLGSMPSAPGQPPAVISDQNKVTTDQLVGGTGAGEETSDSSPVDTAPQSNVLPVDTSPTPSPAATTTSPTPSPAVTTPSEPASPSASATTSPPATPPTEATTTPPATDPTDTTTEPTGPAPTTPSEDESDDPSWPPHDEDNGGPGNGGGTGWDGVGQGDRAVSRAAASSSR